VDIMVIAILMSTSKNPLVEGNADVLRVMRKVVDTYKGNPPDQGSPATAYLIRKGDASDLERLSDKTSKFQKYSARARLGTRVNGTNVLSCTILNYSQSTNKSLEDGSYIMTDRGRYATTRINLDFTPSVANTGKQAVYAREILQHYWKREGEIPDNFRSERGEFYLERANQALSKIPSELLTIVVSFDKDGKPVSNVDLAKYGLSMPVITPKPDEEREHGTPLWYNNTVTFPHLNEPPPP